MYELNPSEEYQRRAATASTEFSEYLRTLARERRERARRRPDQRAGAGRRRGRTPDRGRADRDLRPAAERGPRGHRELDRSALVLAVPQPVATRGPRAPIPTRSSRRRLRSSSGSTRRCRCSTLGPRGRRAPRQRIPRGAGLGLLYGSANRDPAVFDGPDGSTWRGGRTITSPSGRGSTSAWARRSRASSCRRRSARSCGGCRPRAGRGTGVEAELHHARGLGGAARYARDDRDPRAPRACGISREDSRSRFAGCTLPRHSRVRGVAARRSPNGARHAEVTRTWNSHSRTRSCIRSRRG